MARDIELLQGVWSVTALESDGQQMPSQMLASARIEIKGNRFTTSGMGAVYEGIVELDENSGPRRLDMRFDAGPEKGNTNPGIYELDGGNWKICLATRGAVRPGNFSSTAGSGFVIETLTRGDAQVASETAAPAPAAIGSTEFDGEWQLVSAVMNGQAMDQSAVQWVKRVTQGSQTTVYAGPQVMLKVEFTRDPGTSPKSIDYVNLAGPNKGKSQLGIYKSEDGLLTFCVAASGSPRPANFQGVPGDDRTLTVWKRK